MLSTSSQKMCSSMVVGFVRQQQQQHRLISCSRSLVTTTIRATTTTKLKEVVVVDGVKQQHQQQQRSLLLLNPPFLTMSMSYIGSNMTSTKRTMMTNSTTSVNDMISNRGGAIIPNLLLSATNNTNENNNIEDNGIHLPPPDDPVGLQLYKKVLYCPNTNILRTSLHIGTDDLNQKVNGIVVGDDNNILGNDVGIISSQDAKNHARNSGLRLLSSIHHYLNGDLSRVEQIINVTGIVNVGSNNNNNNKVPYGSIIDGCSQVFAEAFGSDIGIGTRVCYGGSIGSTVACYVELRIRPPL